jgi:hypothetical protein
LYRDGKRVLECLQRALRVADACMDTAVSVELFVEILNRYVYYFDQQNEAVSFYPYLQNRTCISPYFTSPPITGVIIYLLFVFFHIS